MQSPQTPLPPPKKKLLGMVLIFLLFVECGYETFYYKMEVCPCYAGRFRNTQTPGIWVTHKKCLRWEKKFKENVKACALLFVFQSQRENSTVAARENICHFFPHLLNIRNIFMKYDLIQLLKINMEMNFLLLTYSQEKAVGKCLLMFKL